MAIKILPHNDEAEQSVLGAILIDKEAITIVSEHLRPNHFYNERNGIIFECMLALSDLRKPIDFLTLTNELKKKKMAAKIESDYITSLVDSVPTSANVLHYAQIVKETAIKRTLIESGTKIAEMGYADEKEISEILNTAESSIFTISQGNITKGFVPIKETLTTSFDRINELEQAGEGLRGVPTGFHDLDMILSGMQNSNLLILAARPGTGKTALAINIASYVGVERKMPVGIFSLEMSNEELVDRLLVGQADIDAWKLKTGKLPDGDMMKLSEAMGQLADAPIFIDDTPGLSIAEMRSKARRLQMEHGVRLIIVDYLQLVDPGKKFESRVQEVSYVSQSLKNIARELKVPVLSLSQLSRAVEHRGERKPQLADLRESGAIEQDADVVMFIYKPDEDVYAPTTPTKLLIAKHRNGRTGEIDLLFKGDRIKFYSAEKQHQDVPEMAN